MGGGMLKGEYFFAYDVIESGCFPIASFQGIES